MNRKRNIWLIAGVVILLATLVSAFVAMQPSAKEILTQTLETSKTFETGHAVVNISVDSPEEKLSATVEVWARHDEDGPGAFRLEVLETDKEEQHPDCQRAADGDLTSSEFLAQPQGADEQEVERCRRLQKNDVRVRG